jgi:2-hydroxy-6-oxonona-2,4-dienedioate hydrolase
VDVQLHLLSKRDLVNVVWAHKQVRMEAKIIELGEFKYLDEGDGEPLVILHGLFGALSNFESARAYLSKRFRVLTPVLPIYELPLRKTSASEISKHIKGFVDALELDKVHLVGNSLGGHVGLIFTKNHLDRVASLTLTASSGLYENAFGNSFPRREDKGYIRDKVATTFYDPINATDELVDECFEAVNNRNKILRILSIAKSAIRHNMEADLPQMAIPVCLIWGKNDIVTPPEVAELFLSKFPDADLFWIDKCGHAPMMEHPDEFNEILGAWYEARGISKG